MCNILLFVLEFNLSIIYAVGKHFIIQCKTFQILVEVLNCQKYKLCAESPHILSDTLRVLQLHNLGIVYGSFWVQALRTPHLGWYIDPNAHECVV